MENKILKKFEATDVIIEVIDGIPMFELYSTGMALGYVKTAKGKHYATSNNREQGSLGQLLTCGTHFVKAATPIKTAKPAIELAQNS